MFVDETEAIGDTEAVGLSEFVESAELSEQEWDFDAQGIDTWEPRCGEKSNAAVLLRAKQTKFLCSASYLKPAVNRQPTFGRRSS